MKKNTRVLIALIIAFVMFSSPAFAITEQESRGTYDYLMVENVAGIVSNYYRFDTTREYLMNAAFYEKLIHPDGDIEDMISAIMSSLDKHSSYMTKEEYEYMIAHTISGEFAGIGVSINRISGRIVVISPIIDSPADAAGILPNDIIAYVNGENVLESTVEYVQAKVTGEIGTSVNIGILRGTEILYFDIVRAKINETTVRTKILDSNIGYIMVTNFNKNTAEEAKIALEEFDEKGIEKLIVDVRNNPGGELTAAVNFCDLFIPKGVVAHIKYKDSSNNEIFYSQLKEKKYELVVLINGGSASASELFSGSVKDTYSGTIIGETTYGKGTVQTIMPFNPTGGALRITIAEYLTAGGRSINNVGVTPDYSIENKFEYRDTSELVDMKVTLELKSGDENEAVLALEQRLVFLGYMEDVADEVYDEKTVDAVKTFQAHRNLGAIGEANVETLMNLNNIDYDNIKFSVDCQLDTAVKYLATGVIN